MKVKKYYQESKDELAKVIFPTKDQIRIAFISVVIVVSVVTLFLALVDLFFHTTLSSIVS
ncbi:preprotein translocase subunit SecE [Helicobacter didelphidarum]|uniref:Protein translocase subunit SecE n=1 Tax=Helicobacter didelphidarum TaxID=2040648 RepID=A0A3D8IP92_9HELI|nr:preprotein translocase subunit SecE [Helicobacter didelphidarum]RDU66810.1 preprotein translocase subunit SecE [Helicobacter didelphidarum]